MKKHPENEKCGCCINTFLRIKLQNKIATTLKNFFCVINMEKHPETKNVDVKV